MGRIAPADNADTLPPFSANGALPLLRKLLLGLYLFHCGKLRARTSNMSDDLIRYDILTQDALRRVIRKVLEEV
ncbi:MAG: hypothetical protein ACJ8FP_09880, partial [Xanthobacteraceae bacterium]